MSGLLWTIIVILFILWLIGWLAFHIGGIIHIIIVVAVILLIINLLTGRGARL
ncbi:MAG TPA: lmo0937 family membrane protein [Candidatus Baltobacteraceae bacterium]|nr:lmo0937 family membrane protein [Candidatus Baltobacteraceae bacterium]